MSDVFRCKSKWFIPMLLLVLLISGCSQEVHQSELQPATEWIEEMLGQMSLEEKIGQMFLVGFEEVDREEATRVNGQAKQLIEKYHIGGIILFSRNIKDVGQVAQLNNELQKLSKSSNNGLPLLIAIDQEGGKVNRIYEGVTVFPGNMALGATRNPQLVYEQGKQMGEELRAMGINLNLAPVLDVNNNPQNPIIGVRSFAEDPKLTAELSSSMLRGFRDGHVLTAVKHFPGHGDTTVDSHIDLPQIPHSKSRLDQVELVPFRQAIQTGADLIMSTHITFPALEPTPGLPGTLSKKVLTDLLRNELGYQGVIITDDMEMGAIADNFGTEQATVKAIQAGADVVLIGHSLSNQVKAIEAVKRAVKQRTITEERINESVRRILALKLERLGDQSIYARPFASEQVMEEVGRPEAQELANRIAEEAVTLLSGSQDWKPLDPAKQSRLLVLTMKKSSSLDQALQKEGFQPSVVQIQDLNPLQLAELVHQAQTGPYDAIIVGTNAIRSDSAQVKLITQLSQLSKPLVVVGLDTPYERKFLPDPCNYLAVYGSTDASLQAVAKALSGKLSFQGQLPVTVSQAYPFGAGNK